MIIRECISILIHTMVISCVNMLSSYFRIYCFNALSVYENVDFKPKNDINDIKLPWCVRNFKHSMWYFVLLYINEFLLKIYRKCGSN